MNFLVSSVGGLETGGFMTMIRFLGEMHFLQENHMLRILNLAMYVHTTCITYFKSVGTYSFETCLHQKCITSRKNDIPRALIV